MPTKRDFTICCVLFLLAACVAFSAPAKDMNYLNGGRYMAFVPASDIGFDENGTRMIGVYAFFGQNGDDLWGAICYVRQIPYSPAEGDRDTRFRYHDSNFEDASTDGKIKVITYLHDPDWDRSFKKDPQGNYRPEGDIRKYVLEGKTGPKGRYIDLELPFAGGIKKKVRFNRIKKKLLPLAGIFGGNVDGIDYYNYDRVSQVVFSSVVMIYPRSKKRLDVAVLARNGDSGDYAYEFFSGISLGTAKKSASRISTVAEDGATIDGTINGSLFNGNVHAPSFDKDGVLLGETAELSLSAGLFDLHRAEDVVLNEKQRYKNSWGIYNVFTGSGLQGKVYLANLEFTGYLGRAVNEEHFRNRERIPLLALSPLPTDIGPGINITGTYWPADTKEGDELKIVFTRADGKKEVFKFIAEFGSN